MAGGRRVHRDRNLDDHARLGVSPAGRARSLRAVDADRREGKRLQAALGDGGAALDARPMGSVVETRQRRVDLPDLRPVGESELLENLVVLGFRGALLPVPVPGLPQVRLDLRRARIEPGEPALETPPDFVDLDQEKPLPRIPSPASGSRSGLPPNKPRRAVAALRGSGIVSRRSGRETRWEAAWPTESGIGAGLGIGWRSGRGVAPGPRTRRRSAGGSGDLGHLGALPSDAGEGPHRLRALHRRARARELLTRIRGQ
jgi:hypothetical protein